MKSRNLLIALLLAATQGCGMIIGIEDLSRDNPDGSGGAGPSTGGATSGGSGGVGGTGGSGGSTGGAAGSGGATGGTSGAGGFTDAAVDARDAGPADASTDMRVDTPSDRANDTPSSDTLPPDAPSSDAIDADARDGSIADTSLDTGSPDGSDAAPPDAPAFDTGADAPVDTGPTVITVNGRIIDFWRRGVPSVQVRVGAVTTTTDGSGQFTVAGVNRPYDVSFTISTVRANSPAKLGWIYQGLNRTDPTLQVGQGFPERGSSELVVDVTGIDFNSLPPTEGVHVALGGPDGALGSDFTGGPSTWLSVPWFGPQTISMTGHALHWSRASSSTLDLPTGYLGNGSANVSLTDNVASNLTIAAPSSMIANGNVLGVVTPSTQGGVRENNVFLRYDDNAVIQLAQDATQPTNFTYLVPTIAQSSITVAASQGYWSMPPYAVAHRDGLAASNTSVALQIPESPSLVAPADGVTGVTHATLFRWSGSAKVFVWAISSNANYEWIYVVTTAKQTQIPNLPDGPVLPSNTNYLWWVETHGSYQTMDEATGPNGMLDSFRSGVLSGPARVDGSYTSSEEHYFTTQ